MVRKHLDAKTCRAHKKLRPCPCCASASITQKRIWQTSQRRMQHRASQARRDSAFLEPEIRLIKTLAGTMSSMDVTSHVNTWRVARGFQPRGLESIRTWSQGHGVPLSYGTVRTNNELISLLGVSYNTIRAWRSAGVLVGQPWGKFWVYPDAELLALITRDPWRVDVTHMAYGPFRQAVEVAGKRDPWLGIHAFALAVPTSLNRVIEAIKTGAIPFRQRTGHHGAYRLQASSVGLLRSLLGQVKQARAETYGLLQLGQLMGVSERTVRWWWKSGFLEGHQVNTRWMFTEAAIIRMLKHHPYLVDTKKIPIKWAMVVTKLATPKLRGRWISVPEAAKLADTTPVTVLKYIYQGKLDAAHRNQHEWAVRRKTALPQLLQVMAEARARRIQQLDLSPCRHKRAA